MCLRKIFPKVCWIFKCLTKSNIVAKEIQRRGETSKSIKLGSKMTIADLRNKASAAQGIAKQVKNVRIYMIVTDETEENGRNVMFTVKIPKWNSSKEFLV